MMALHRERTACHTPTETLRTVLRLRTRRCSTSDLTATATTKVGHILTLINSHLLYIFPPIFAYHALQIRPCESENYSNNNSSSTPGHWVATRKQPPPRAA